EVLRLETPSQCGFYLAAIAAISLAAAFLLPGARNAILPSPYRDARNLVIISPHRYFATPTISIEDYQSWTTSAMHLFTGIAFYQPVVKPLRIGQSRAVELSVARASDNLFELLNVPILSPPPQKNQRAHTAALILSRSAWREYFGGDPQIIGRVLYVDGQQALVSGIVSDDSWRLPGRLDAWLLEDARTLAAVPPRSKGFVLAHVETFAFHPWPDGRWHMSAPNEDGDSDAFDCVSVAERVQRPSITFLLIIVFAFLVLPATTSMSLGEYPASRNSPPWATRLRRWIFLSAKIALILPIVYCGSLDLAYISTSLGSFHIRVLASVADHSFEIAGRCCMVIMAFASFILPATASATRLWRWIVLSTAAAFILPIVCCVLLKAAYLSTSISALNIQIIASSVGCILAFRWVVIDQRRRCPVCLNLLSHPAQVGQPSRNFLGWSGTELMCVRGHGLLHVPEVPTSWFSTQRWHYLDPSWSGLFS
ncbi:MAG: hypothetical protein JWO80_1605, partial [Bryobacterales bacterium]|nr:hypothetical protein [Bryobacterales bacterium]